MGMRVAVLLLVVFVSLTEAAGCIPTTSPWCYKNSTLPEEDFMCKWDERNPKENQTHTLFIWDSEKKRFIMCAKSGDHSERYILLEELGITTRKTDIWVQTQVDNLTCNSSNISVILECLVKYSAPNITKMIRSAGILSLKLERPKDNKSVKYEIRWRERGSEWQNVTFETKDNTIQEDQTTKTNKMAEDHLLSLHQDGRPWYVEEFLDSSHLVSWSNTTLNTSFQMGLDAEKFKTTITTLIQ